MLAREMSSGERDADLENARARTLAALEILRTEDEIDAAEYERRVSVARGARSARELFALQTAPSTPVLAPRGQPHPEDEHGAVVAVLTGVRRSGAWEPPETLRVLNVLGGVHLDFREAELLEGVTEVVVTTILGGVHIVAPPGAHVSSDGIAVLGDFAHCAHRSPHADAPTLRVQGISVLGGVTVKIKS